MLKMVKKREKSLFTPSYIYDKNLIIKNLSFLKEVFSSCNAEIFFAVKANTSISLLKIIKEEGVGAEVTSPGEIFVSLKAGFKPEKILYNNIARKEEEILYAIKKGVIFFNFESIDQAILLEKCARKLNKKIKTFIRINPGIFPPSHPHLSTGSKNSKFGITFEELKNNLKKLKKLKFAKIVGIHSHIGSQILEPEPFVKNAKKVEEVFNFLKEKKFEIEYLNLGGGFGIPYLPNDKNLDFDPIKKAYENLYKRYNLKIFLEPGRFIVGNAGYILTRVISIKERDNMPLYIIDAGLTENPRPALYNAYHHIKPLYKKKGEIIRSRVAGPLCENSDEFGIYDLPRLKIGDLLIIYNCGAYTRTMASNYNGRPFAPEYLFDKNLKIIRKKQKFERLIEDEKY
ncbi:MAG: diaminopimelate decarboxylase [candidate division WOR-3 bacterium]